MEVVAAAAAAPVAPAAPTGGNGEGGNGITTGSDVLDIGRLTRRLLRRVASVDGRRLAAFTRRVGVRNTVPSISSVTQE